MSNIINLRKVEKFDGFRTCKLMRELSDDFLLPQHLNTLKTKFKNLNLPILCFSILLNNFSLF